MNEKKAHDILKEYSPLAFKGYNEMISEILKDGALSTKTKEFLLIGIFAAQRYEEGLMLHARKAINAGATPEEIHEIALTTLISRGPVAYSECVKALKLVDRTVQPKAKKEREPSEDEILAALRKSYGILPNWVETMMEINYGALKGYFKIRKEVLKNGALPKKIKELVMLGINAAELYDDGIEIHVKRAYDSGASGREIYEAILVATVAGGMVSWLEGCKMAGKARIFKLRDAIFSLKKFAKFKQKYGIGYFDKI